MIPELNDPVPKGFKKIGSLCIIFHLLCVLATISFHNQLGFQTSKIHDHYCHTKANRFVQNVLNSIIFRVALKTLDMKFNNWSRHSGKCKALIRNPMFSEAYWMPDQVRHDSVKLMGQH